MNVVHTLTSGVEQISRHFSALSAASSLGLSTGVYDEAYEWQVRAQVEHSLQGLAVPLGAREPLIRKSLERLPPQPKVLVVFGRPGGHALALSRLGFRVAALMATVDAAEVLREKSSAENLNVEVIVSRTLFPPELRGCFNAAYVDCTYGRFPLRHRLELLRNVAVVLKEPGAIYLSAGLRTRPHSPLYTRVAGAMRSAAGTGEPPEPGDRMVNGCFLHYFDEDALAGELSGTGFEVVNTAFDAKQRSVSIEARKSASRSQDPWRGLAARASSEKQPGLAGRVIGQALEISAALADGMYLGLSMKAAPSPAASRSKHFRSVRSWTPDPEIEFICAAAKRMTQPASTVLVQGEATTGLMHTLQAKGYAAANGEACTTAEGSFDIVYGSYLFFNRHLRYAELCSTLGALRRALRPQGKLIAHVVTHGGDAPAQSCSDAVRWLGRRRTGHLKTGYLRKVSATVVARAAFTPERFSEYHRILSGQPVYAPPTEKWFSILSDAGFQSIQFTPAPMFPFCAGGFVVAEKN